MDGIGLIGSNKITGVICVRTLCTEILIELSFSLAGWVEIFRKPCALVTAVWNKRVGGFSLSVLHTLNSMGVNTKCTEGMLLMNGKLFVGTYCTKIAQIYCQYKANRCSEHLINSIWSLYSLRIDSYWNLQCYQKLSNRIQMLKQNFGGVKYFKQGVTGRHCRNCWCRHLGVTNWKSAAIFWDCVPAISTVIW